MQAILEIFAEKLLMNLVYCSHDEDDAIRVTKEGRVASNRSNGMSGRDLFTFNPNLGLDSDDEGEEKDEFDIVGYRAEAARRKKEVEEERMQNLAEEFDDYTIEDGV